MDRLVRFLARAPVWAAAGCVSLLVSCDSAPPEPAHAPPASGSVEVVATTDLRPGPTANSPALLPELVSVSRVFAPEGAPEPTAHDLGEGRRLYARFNCVGCHANGGGGMGPPFIDDKWIYGSAPEQVMMSVLQGRPQGMPAFEGRIPDHYVWQLAAYVRSLGGLTEVKPPGRHDTMGVATPRPAEGAGQNEAN